MGGVELTDKLLTKKDLAEHWQVSLQTIDNYIADGIITPIKSIPSIRFSPQYISEFEGIKLEKFSPLERRRLERELEEWKLRAEKAEKAVVRANIVLMEAIYSGAKEA